MNLYKYKTNMARITGHYVQAASQVHYAVRSTPHIEQYTHEVHTAHAYWSGSLVITDDQDFCPRADLDDMTSYTRLT